MRTRVTRAASGGLARNYMSGRVFLDGNVLIYAQDAGAPDPFA